jgi:hypothetical protein
MKHLFSTLLLVTLVAGAAGFVAYRATADDEVARALAKQDALEWMRVDFDLTETQFAAIKQLHDSYSLVCEEHCREIQRAARERSALKAGGNATPEVLAAADRKVEALRQVCESAIATHVRECATHMSPEAGQRYLALVLPKIRDFNHQAPPDLRLNQTHRH